MCLLLGKRAPFVRPRSLTFAPCQWLADANADMSRGMTSPQARSVVKVLFVCTVKCTGYTKKEGPFPQHRREQTLTNVSKTRYNITQ